MHDVYTQYIVISANISSFQRMLFDGVKTRLSICLFLLEDPSTFYHCVYIHISANRSNTWKPALNDVFPIAKKGHVGCRYLYSLQYTLHYTIWLVLACWMFKTCGFSPCLGKGHPKHKFIKRAKSVKHELVVPGSSKQIGNFSPGRESWKVSAIDRMWLSWRWLNK